MLTNETSVYVIQEKSFAAAFTYSISVWVKDQWCSADLVIQRVHQTLVWRHMEEPQNQIRGCMSIEIAVFECFVSCMLDDAVKWCWCRKTFSSYMVFLSLLSWWCSSAYWAIHSDMFTKKRTKRNNKKFVFLLSDLKSFTYSVYTLLFH